MKNFLPKYGAKNEYIMLAHMIFLVIELQNSGSPLSTQTQIFNVK